MSLVPSRNADANEPVRGFILQASYRIQDGTPVVYLYGVLEDGGTFLVRDRRQTPSFHIRRRDAALAWTLGATRQMETANTTFAGEPALRVDVGVPQDAPPLRDRLHGHGVPTYEADVRFAVRYLIDRGIRGGCEIVGESTTPADDTVLRRVFDDPLLRPADVTISPSVLSFDIETDPKAQRLLAIALYGQGVDEVLIVDEAGRDMPERAQAYPT